MELTHLTGHPQVVVEPHKIVHDAEITSTVIHTVVNLHIIMSHRSGVNISMHMLSIPKALQYSLYPGNPNADYAGYVHGIERIIPLLI